MNFGRVKIHLDIFTVFHAELYKNRVPSVIPLSCCKVPDDKEQKEGINDFNLIHASF